MKVHFSESYYIWYSPILEYEAVVRFGVNANGHSGYFTDHQLIEETHEKIHSLLKEKFSSVEFSPENVKDFRLRDCAEEAEFLLWSTGGIDI